MHKFKSSVRPTSFSLHPETISRLRLASNVLSKQYDKRISMSKIVEKATHDLMDTYGVRDIKRVTPAATENASKASSARKRAVAARKRA